MKDKTFLELRKKYGKAFYVLDSEQFKKNFLELKNAFSSIYPKFNIAYSYKTNYVPKLCRIVNEFGGFAEVVSEMEMELALRVGVCPQMIIWNGPYKNPAKVEELLLSGGTVNLDSVYEIELIRDISHRNPSNKINIGIRCNFEINDNLISRFGFDTDSEEFYKALELSRLSNIHLVGLQCHFASRRLETWPPRVHNMLSLLDKLRIIPEHIDLGGGLFGKMADSLKAQFDSDIPTYQNYAEAIAPVFAEHFKNETNPPMLLIEPGSALVGDCMQFAATVINIKKIRNKPIATLLGSIYNINPTLNKKNPPFKVIAAEKDQTSYKDLDFGGYTCIESDYVYRNYSGKLAVDDLVVFGNAGSYSIVLKPPFILPNFPIIDFCNGQEEIIKQQECFDDIFHTFRV